MSTPDTPKASQDIDAMRAELANLRAELSAQKAYQKGYEAAQAAKSQESPKPVAGLGLNIGDLLSFQIISKMLH